MNSEDKLINYVEYMSKLVDYINLLRDELDDVVIIAYNHGWRSNRASEGKNKRNEIIELSKKLLLPNPFDRL
jgi:chitinase